MATRRNSANDLARMQREVGDPDWNSQFSGIESSLTEHYNKIWESLFADVWRFSPLGIALNLLSKKPGNKWRILLVRCTFGYRRRYKAFNALINAEENAAKNFAIPPETRNLRNLMAEGDADIKISRKFIR